MQSVIFILDIVINVIFFLVLAQLIITLLVQFQVASIYNPIVRTVLQALDTVLGPLLNPIRRILPSTGGLDFSPMVLLIGLTIVQGLLAINFQ